MKRNLMSVLVLALVVVNIVLSAVTMVSIISTNKKTGDLVNNITTAMNLQLTNPGGTVIPGNTQVALADTKMYDVGTMTMRLASEPGDSSDHYLKCDISLSMNSQHEDYATYGESMDEYLSLIKDAIQTEVSQHTRADCNDMETLKEDILYAVQGVFGSDFIFRVAVSGDQVG